MGALGAWAGPALADSTGSLSGNGNSTSNPQSGSSLCPAGDVVHGITRFTDTSGVFTGGAQAVCVDAHGKVNLGNVIGASGASATSTCPGRALGVGLYGRAGDVIDGFGVRCNKYPSSPATNSDANYAGDSGGGPQGPFDCPAGFRLTGLTGTSAEYFGRVDLVTLTGVCSPAEVRGR
jgi:hypothetical protein